MITLPEDTAASRLHRGRAEPEDVLDTLREYQRIARTECPSYTIKTEFLAGEDMDQMVPVWFQAHPPVAARAIVTRDGVVTEEWRSWHESIPADDETRDEWNRNPATRLRAFVERAALRNAFADVIVGRDRHAPEPSARTAGDPWMPAEIAEAGQAAMTAVTAAAEAVTAPRPTPRAPQDHLPGNRAQRRARTKKKGRR